MIKKTGITAVLVITILTSSVAVAFPWGIVLAVASTVIGTAQGVISGRANEKAAIAQQKTFEALFLSVNAANAKLDGLLAEVYQIADEIEGLPLQTAKTILGTQLLGTANAVSNEVVQTTQNSLNYSIPRISRAQSELSNLRVQLNIILEQVRVLPTEQRRTLYNSIALAEEVYLATYLAADYLSSAEYYQQANSGEHSLSDCNPELIADFERLGLPLDQVSCDPQVERSEQYAQEMLMVEDMFNSFWEAELSEISALSLDIRKHFPGSDQPAIYIQSHGEGMSYVLNQDTAPRFSETPNFPNVTVTPGNGSLPLHSVRTLVLDHTKRYLPDLLTTRLPHSGDVCGVTIPWVNTYDLSHVSGWENVGNRPLVVQPMGVGWGIGQLVEGQYADSYLQHENEYVAWMEESWSENLQTIPLSEGRDLNPSNSSASISWVKNQDNRFLPDLNLNLPGCSGLPVYVTFYEVGSDSSGLSELCEEYPAISSTIVRNGWCERDIINLNHDYNHPMAKEDWLELRARYFSLITNNTRETLATAGVGPIIGEGAMFPIERDGPYFPSVVQRWEQLANDQAQDVTREDIAAVEALSDVSSYLAASYILAERMSRANQRNQ